jgi:flagellar hook-basal body complex protein FliE
MVDKIANPAAAANAYSNMAKIGVNAPTPGDQAGKASFGDLLKDIAVNSIQTMRNSETMSAKAITGEATLPDVVQAVNAADLTLQTVVAVRDRLINAYQEVMRMPI